MKLTQFKLALITGGIASFLCGGFANALELVSNNWDITNNTGVPANDFHVIWTVEQPAFIIPPGEDDFYDDGIFQDRACDLMGSGFMFECIWDNASRNIGLGEKIHVGFNFRSNRNEKIVKDAFWTLDGVKLPDPQPKLTGFRATGLGNNLTYTVLNGTNEELTIQDLQFKIDTEETDLQLLNPYTLPGFSASIPTFTLSAGASATFQPGSINGGEFLLAQLTTFPTANPSNVTQIMEQHEAKTPEPTSTLSLLSLGILGAGATLKRKVKRTHSLKK